MKSTNSVPQWNGPTVAVECSDGYRAQAQQAIGRFSRHPVTWAVLLLIGLESLVAVPFIEQRRWPFSYPADPSVYKENEHLRDAAQANQQNAAKWQFASRLRNEVKNKNGSPAICRYWLTISSGQNAWNMLTVLQSMLDLAHWEPIGSNPDHSVSFKDITVLAGDNELSKDCAYALGKFLGEAFPDKHINVNDAQATSALSACKNECVELDLGD